MNVVAFRQRPQTGCWTEAELAQLRDARLTQRDAERDGGWEFGVTEAGDPQLYLLGPLPEQACELCLSRTGRGYVLEDGAGRLLFEHPNLDLVALHARAALQRGRRWIGAQLLLLWCAIRHVIHDRIEPLMSEGEELLVHLTPQLLALA